MSLIERLHKAEHQGREAARERFSRALINLEEAQSRLRRRMRLHPRPGKAAKPLLGPPGKDTVMPIVTINGRDVPPEDVPAKPLEQREEEKREEQIA